MTLLSTSLGKTFTLNLLAYNLQGSVTSPNVKMLFAVPPSAPSSGP